MWIMRGDQRRLGLPAPSRTNWGRATVAVAMTLGLGMARPSVAADSAADAIYPVVDRQHYELLCRVTAPDRENRAVADAVFSQYSDDLKKLLADVEAAAAQAGRDRIAGAVSGKTRATLEQVAQWELAVLETYAKAWPRADRLFEDLLADLRSALTSATAEQFEAATRALRRSLLLPMRKPMGVPANAYLGDALDVIQLVERVGAERGPMPGLVGAGGADVQGAFATPEVTTALSNHALQLDSFLGRTFAADREGRLLRKRAEVSRDRAALASVDAAAVVRWHELYELNLATARQIGAALTAGPQPEREQQWRRQFDRALAPWLFTDEQSDRAFAWIGKQAGDDPLRQKAAEIYDPFVAERQELRQTALEALVAARVRGRAMLRPLGIDPAAGSDASRQQAQHALDSKFHELIALEAGARKKFEGLLTDEQLRAMRKDLGLSRSPARR